MTLINLLLTERLGMHTVCLSMLTISLVLLNNLVLQERIQVLASRLSVLYRY